MRRRFTRVRLGERLDQGRTDWKRVDALSDADVATAIAEDPDALEVLPGWLENAMLLRPGRGKRQITVRLDADVIDWFKSQGKGYQTRMNAVLRAYCEARKDQDEVEAKRTETA